jgi:hypothetical protein
MMKRIALDACHHGAPTTAGKSVANNAQCHSFLLYAVGDMTWYARRMSGGINKLGKQSATVHGLLANEQRPTCALHGAPYQTHRRPTSKCWPAAEHRKCQKHAGNGIIATKDRSLRLSQTSRPRQDSETTRVMREHRGTSARVCMHADIWN